ncbi:MAG: hypothetical protein A2X19_06690 [Bacteroidetes bacterium GWE2_39_28]|nr:MAG: hypothetical protein A2X19_06690 [Bacteroidetes bacterium GWE2_39_28]OFY13345.1 MAG: hypothetical protein A2X16_00205 [Bacteroidetes bacterium GWF2_39_10]OFZ09719.1 MAG: hypothetical protein A2465_09770 [Bacteroidetes bacterium RIFOXYC2_FULL_39_11]HCT94537.1 lipopolysaccharide biosynthesis protein [Rikenellaceae bacterium]
MEELNKIKGEIDLIEVSRKLWQGRKFILLTSLTFAIFGLLIALMSPNYYTSKCTIVPQTGDKSGASSLSGIAAIAGINLGSFSSGTLLSPSVYPKILNNINFQKEIIYSLYCIEKADNPITYFEYQTNRKYKPFTIFEKIKKYTIGLPGVIIRTINKKPNTAIESHKQEVNTILALSYNENAVINTFLEFLSLNLNNKDGYITLSFKSREPKLSAEVVIKTQKLLQKYITEFKLEKVRENLEFVENSYNEARINFENKQTELAKFRDANKTLSSALARTQEEKLTSEYNLLLSIYTELAKQKEQAKIAVTETTPVFTIIEPAHIPVAKSSPQRGTMIILYLLVGFFISIVYVLIVTSFNENLVPGFKNYKRII